MTDKPRYTYFFYYRDDRSKPAYVTTAYSVTQAVRQLAEKYPTKPIYAYFDNEGFDIDRKPYVPKEEPPKPKKDYTQLGFKGFVQNNPWPSK